MLKKIEIIESEDNCSVAILNDKEHFYVPYEYGRQYSPESIELLMEFGSAIKSVKSLKDYCKENNIELIIKKEVELN
jgi:hypothetical protein